MSAELDLTGLTEKESRKGTKYYEDLDGKIVAKECTKCREWKELRHFYNKRSGFDGKMAYCKKCSKNACFKYRNNNQEKIRKYEQQRKESVKEYNQTEYRRRYYKNYRKENREMLNLKSKIHYEKNRSKVLLRCKKYQDENRDYYRAYNRMWGRENREARHLHYHRRRARKALLPDTLTAEQQTKILAKFNGVCALTGSKDIQWDHAIPVSVGHGGTTRENMYPLRADLNTSKSARNIFDWFYVNKERFNLDQRKFDELIEYLANINDMSVEEYEAYVRWCHDNPRDIGEIDEETSAS